MAPVTSADGMSATSLAERIRAEVVAKDMTWSALQKAAKVSQKTITALREGDPRRRWGHTTLAKLDDVFGLARGTLYTVWQQESRPDDLAAEVQAIKARLSEIEERPPWAAELIEVVGSLSSDDRAVLLQLARRLASSR